MSTRETLSRTFAAAAIAFASVSVPFTVSALAQEGVAVGQAGSDLDERLGWIAEQVERAMSEHHTPGVALAVVKDGEVVMLRGFGLADVESGRAVTPDTRFAIGSTSKAFTATVIGMLADEGVMSFDEPVRTYLPMFRLKDPVADEQVTVRDLLCHRAGFAIMNGVWYGLPDITRQEVLDTMVKAELLHPFRERWNYSNESFLAAGVAAGHAAGSDWDSLILTRIFVPLGMDESNTSYAAAQADPLMAEGYLWDEDKGELEHQPMRRVDAVGPAGSINSSVHDMSRWVLFQLGRGQIEGRRLLSEEMHAETWKKHIDLSLGTLSGSYGLGWFLGEWEGRPMVEHAGGIDGFTAEVAMLPDENVGMVMLTNQFGSPLQELSRKLVFRGLLGDISEAAGAVLAEDFEPYTGNYIANFGPFHDAVMKVLVKNDRLAVDVPGQMVFELQPPDAGGKRPFVLTDAVAVSFNRNERDEVYSLTFFQSGMEFEAIREGMEAPIEIDLAAVQDCLGVYRLEEQGLDLTALIQNNRLAIDHPGQMVYELRPPDADGWCTLRVSEDIRVRFDRDESGMVVSITQLQGGVETVMPRIGDIGEGRRLPTVDEVIAWADEAGVLDLEGSLHSLRLEGTITAVHMGLSGPELCLDTTDGRGYSAIDLGGGRLTETWVSGDSGMVRAYSTGDTEMTPKMIASARAQSPLAWAGDWRRVFDSVAVTGKRRFDGRDVFVVSATLGEGWARLLVDTESHLPLAIETTFQGAMGAELPITLRLDDWREVAGVKIPHRQEVEIPLAGKMRTEYATAEANVPLEEAMFQPPEKRPE